MCFLIILKQNDMKNILKNIVIVLVLSIGSSACDKDPEMKFNGDLELCSCLNMEDINKTIPIVNEFLTGLPNGISEEQTFESLQTWLKSFPCDIDAKILIGKDMDWGREQMYGFAISIKDNEIIRELSLDFLGFNDEGISPYSQIAGYSYDKQDAIHVKTKYSKINNVFDFINSLGFDVKNTGYGTYISSMPADLANLEFIINNLKAKPYTNDNWVIGHLNWYMPGITFFVNLYDIHNKDYQADWIKTMNDYKLVEYDFANEYKDYDEDYIYGPGHLIVFYIPEETGKQWETKFMEYSFVRWSELSYTKYTIR